MYLFFITAYIHCRITYMNRQSCSLVTVTRLAADQRAGVRHKLSSITAREITSLGSHLFYFVVVVVVVFVVGCSLQRIAYRKYSRN